MYDYDVSIIKEYGYDDSIKKYKVISMNVLRNKGVEPIHKNYVNNRCKVNYEKLSENIIRAKNKIFESLGVFLYWYS